MSLLRPSDSWDRRAARWTRAEAIKDQWLHGLPPDTRAVLQADPELGQDKQIVLDLAYEEYCLQQEAGQAPPAEEFAAQFPTHCHSLMRLLAVHSFIQGCPDSLRRPAVRWPGPGDTLAEFKIIRQLGRGGFAHVYLARETTTGNRAVVLKISADGLDEANTLGPISHPHIMRVLSARRIGELSVLVMPFLGTATLEDIATAKLTTGDQLREVCRTTCETSDPPATEGYTPPFQPDRFDQTIAAIGLEVADALAFLHSEDLAHQDLKPSNVLLTPSGYPFLLDFNLTTQAHQSRSTVGGTVPYMAPEQLVTFCTPGASPTYDCSAADVYSLGVILYELLAGHHPFPTIGAAHNLAIPTRETLLARHQTPESLATVNPSVDTTLAAIVMACLATDPTHRPTARELATQLRHLVDPPPPLPPARKGRRWIAIGAVVAVVAAIVGAVLLPGTAPPFERGMILLNDRQFELAGKEFQSAGQAEGDGRAYAFAAYCYAECRLLGPSMMCADEAIQLGYRHACVPHNRAYCNWQRSRLAEAIQDCEEALKCDPNCVESHYLRAMATQRLQQANPTLVIDQSVTDGIDLVRRNRPQIHEASLLAAQLYAARGTETDLVKAASAIREAVERGDDPKHIQRMMWLVKKLAGEPDFQKAMQQAQPSPRGEEKVKLLIRPPQ